MVQASITNVIQLHTFIHMLMLFLLLSPLDSFSHVCPLGCWSRCDKCCRLNQSTPLSPLTPSGEKEDASMQIDIRRPSHILQGLTDGLSG